MRMKQIILISLELYIAFIHCLLFSPSRMRTVASEWKEMSKLRVCHLLAVGFLLIAEPNFVKLVLSLSRVKHPKLCLDIVFQDEVA